MKKEDVLSKAQKEGMLGIDEGTKQMKNHGRLIGQAMFSLVFVIIAFLAIITKNKIDANCKCKLDTRTVKIS